MSTKRKLSKKRYQESYDTRDKGGARQGFINWKMFKKDNKDVEWFEPLIKSKDSKGINKINIIPFEIKTNLHPLVKRGEMKIGDIDFMLDVWAHRYIGPAAVDVLCPKKNYGKACPICEEVQKLFNEGKTDEAKDIQTSRRVLINVQQIRKSEPQPLKVFDVSHYLFMKELIEEAFDCSEGEDITPFADIDEGKIVKFKARKEKFGSSGMIRFKNFEFLDRDEELDDSIINEAISFDEGLILLSYEEIEKVLYGQDENEDEDENKIDKKENKRKEEKKNKDDEDENDEKPNKKNRTKNKDEDEDDDDNDNDDDDDDKDKDEEKDEDDDEDDPDEKTLKREKKNECPSGHKWGTADEHGKDCKKCPEDTYDACLDV